MKKIGGLLALLVFALLAKAQQNHFIYLQTDDKVPFYAKVNDKLYSSTASGYLIIPKLNDGDYWVNIGFANDLHPEKSFECKVKGKDLGYAVKFMPDGMQLFDLQTFTVLRPSSPKAKPAEPKKEIPAVATDPTNSTAQANPAKKGDSFGEMLSNATGDTSLKTKPVLPKTEEPKVAVAEEAKKPVETVAKEDALNVPDKAKPIVETNVPPQLAKADTPKPAVVTAEEKKVLEEAKAMDNGSITLNKPAVGKKDTPVLEEKKVVDNGSITLNKPAFDKKDTPVLEEKKLTETASITLNKPAAEEKKPVEASKSAELASITMNKPALDTKAVAEKKELPTGTSVATPTVFKETIVKKLQVESGDGVDMVFENKIAPEKNETIRIFIPRENTAAVSSPVPALKMVAKDSLPLSDGKATISNEVLPVATMDSAPAKQEATKPAEPVKKEVIEEKKTSDSVVVPKELKTTPEVVAEAPKKVIEQISTAPKAEPQVDTNLQSTTKPAAAEKTVEAAANVATPKVEDSKKETAPVVMKNTSCNFLADADDFFKVRKQMVAKDDTDDMIAAAKKYFKTRCFSVEQVGNLSALFLTDADRYQFFDMAYPYVHDWENFKNLQSSLVDPYYVNRFKALLK
jgi:hypothetical protein